jgi:hypothetical protein
VQVSTVATFATISYTLNGASLLSASPTGLAYPGVTYYWRAGAVNAAATSWSSTWSFVTLTAPAAPALSYPGNAASVAVGAITATWAAVPTATAYTIQVSTGSTFSTTTLSQSTGTATSYLFTPTANKWNYWKVSATNQTGVVTWSAIWSFISGTSVLSSHDAAAAACDFSMKQGAISYSLPKAEQVEISICDMLGRTAMSISNRQAAGSYSVDLRSSALASGEYVVRFKAGAFEKQNTLMLAR